MIFKSLSFYLALAGLAGGVVLVKKLQTRPPMPPPLVEPSRSPFVESVAGTGIVEASRENVKIGVPKAGLVQAVLVEVGSKVKTGDPLFQLDNREAKARLGTARAQLVVLQAGLNLEKVQVADLEDQFARLQQLEKNQVTSQEEGKRKEFQLQAGRAHLARVEADILAARQQIAQAEVDLELLTVRAPRDGTLLQVAIRPGEYATATHEGVMILGDVDTLQIRVDVDEQDAPLVSPRQPAVAFLKGNTTQPMPLRYVRIEPFVIPKKSLTGDSAERVDTRVLQIIFAMDQPKTPVYVGQQVDVFIQRAGSTPTPSIPAATASNRTISHQ